MKTFKKIIIWILVIILVLVVIGFLLPKNYKVVRSVSIKSNPDLIYDLTGNFNKWKVWVPWTKALDSTVRFEMTGKEGEVGATWKWDGKIMGNGQMTATEFRKGELMAYDLEFQHGKYKSKGKITIEKTGDSCKVTWTDEGDLGYNPISRYFGLMMDKMMGPDFEKGLKKLKTVCEPRASWPKIIEKQMPGSLALLIRDSAEAKTYQKVFARGFGELQNFVKSNRIKCTGHPFAIYIRYDSLTMKGVFDMGFLVEKAEKGKGRIRVEKIPGQHIVMAYYFGPYEKTADTYHILSQYITEGGLQIAGGPWEIYITDPMSQKDQARWETDILFPVK